jgi:hypothetical protein
MLNLFVQRSSSTNNIFDDLPALSAPSKSDLRDELDRYLSTDPEHVTDSVAWWYEKRFVYPRLHRMALDYLTIPGKFIYIFSSSSQRKLIYQLATSVDVERVFSQGRLLLSHIRSRLSVQSTRALMCLGVWSILGFITDSDVRAAVAALPELIGDDEDELDINWDRIS